MSLFLSNNGQRYASTEVNSTPSSSAIHSPIVINGNIALDDFCAGKGTDGLSLSTAHVIENLEIEAEIISGAGSAIKIENTDRYLIIRNCSLRNSQGPFDEGGIILFQCNNVSIVKCELNDNEKGIYLWHSDHISISENKIANGHTGIRLSHSNNNTIWRNEISYNSMIAVYIDITSESNVVRGNIFCENYIDYNDWGKYNQVFGNSGCPSPIIPGYNLLLTLVTITLITLITMKSQKSKRIHF